MLATTWKRQTGIGIDLGTEAIKLVELRKQGAGYQVLSALRMATPQGAVTDGTIANPAALAARLGEMVASGNYRRRPVVTTIGGRKVISRHIRVPVMPEKELDSAVKWEAERYLPFGNQELVMDYLNLGEVEAEGKKQLSILVAAVPAEVARAYYNAFLAAQLELVVIDIVPAALVRWAGSMGNLMPANGSYALVDLGAEMGNLVISSNRQVAFARTIPMGGNLLTEAVARALGINLHEAQRVKEEEARLFEDSVNARHNREQEGLDETAAAMSRVDSALKDALSDLVREIRRSMDFYRTQSPNSPVGRVVLTGGTSLLPGLDRYLAQELDLPVEVGNTVVMGNAHYPGLLDAGYALAAGLALRGVMPY
ncbi:hypothetical protein SY88_11430 [Clostridiales bacterium PH28_bin88]|nr:hypothetical protein SY88_11430 [Clostridiales bacterium PH28_bin88]